MLERSGGLTGVEQATRDPDEDDRGDLHAGSDRHLHYQAEPQSPHQDEGSARGQDGVHLHGPADPQQTCGFL